MRISNAKTIEIDNATYNVVYGTDIVYIPEQSVPKKTETLSGMCYTNRSMREGQLTVIVEKSVHTKSTFATLSNVPVEVDTGNGILKIADAHTINVDYDSNANIGVTFEFYDSTL